MLTVVAGPTNLSAINGEPLVDITGGATALWVEGKGLALLTSFGSHFGDNLYLTNTDGAAAICNTALGLALMGWDYLGNPYIVTNSLGIGTNTYKLKLPCGMPNQGTYDYPANSNGQPQTGFAILPARAIQAYHDTIVPSPSLGSATAAAEYHIPAPFSSSGGNCSLHPYKVDATNSLWYCCNPANGNGYIFLYDANAKTMMANSLTRVSITSSAAAIAYSKKHDLFFVLQVVSGVVKLTVYANEPVANAISAPSFVTSPTTGATVAVQATVTGADGEPCVGRLVTFTSSVGSFLLPTVATDSTGTATALYQVPLTPSMSDTCTATMLE